MSPSSNPQPAPQVHDVTLQPGQSITFSSVVPFQVEVSNPNSRHGELAVTEDGQARRLTLPPFGVAVLPFEAGVVRLTNLGQVVLLVSSGISEAQGQEGGGRLLPESFVIQPGWKLVFDLPHGGRIDLMNGNETAGTVDISQDGKSEPHEVPAKDGISVPVAPGTVGVTNTGSVPLLMTIVSAS